ncbi:MAG: amino acid ABC transporter permease, partial [Mesorhizobium sp.]
MEMVVVAPPAIGKIEDLRRRFFATPLQALLSLASLAVMVFLAWKLLNWAVFSAVFTTSGGPEACQAAAGACWSVIAARWRIILFGLYPYDEQWRSALACLIVVVMTVLSCVPAFWSGRRIALVWGAGTALFYVLMKGGVLGLP